MKLRNIDYEVEERPMVYFKVHDNEHYKDVLLMFTNQARERVEGIIKVKNYYYDNLISLIVDDDRTVKALKEWFEDFDDIEFVEVKNVYVVELFGDIVGANDKNVEFLCPRYSDNFYKVS